MSDDPLTPEERAALRAEAGRRVLETAAELEALLHDRQHPGTARPRPPPVLDPSMVLYKENEDRLRAEATLLEELFALALPECRLLARSIRAFYAPGRPEEDGARLEAFFGSLPARHRQSEWLDVPAVHLCGFSEHPGAFHDAREGDAGASLTHAYWLLMDGRVVELHLVGTWAVLQREVRSTGQTIVGTRVVETVDAVRAAGGLSDIVTNLRRGLHQDYKVLEGKHVPDLAERRARFDAIVTDYAALVCDANEGLRRVGDRPA